MSEPVMMRAFGRRATRWCEGLPADFPLLAFDETGLPGAYLQAVAYRQQSRPFLSWIALPDVRAGVAIWLSGTFDPTQSYDVLRSQSELLARGDLIVDGERSDRWTPPAFTQARGLFAQILRLSDGMFAASRDELERIVAFTTIRRDHTVVAAVARPDLPRPQRTPSSRWLLVWADGLPFAQTLLFRHALGELSIPVVLVADQGAVFAPPGEGGPATVEEALSGAAAIVDTTIDRPSDALALAEWGIPMAVARTSGAAEYLDGVAVFEPSNWRSIYNGAVRALAAGPPHRRPLEPVWEYARTTIAGLTPPSGTGPLVSVIIPTYNRRERLPAALQSILAQRYRPLEIIVVNDGGAAVDDIVAQFPEVRLVSYEQNGGVEHALNTGYAAARGVYVTHVSDDDAFYPDHLARLVAACERSGCAIAHGNTLIRFLRETPSGLELDGFAANVFVQSLEKTEAWWNSPVAGHAYIMRREVGERLGWYDETLPVLGDQEMQTRHAKAYDFIHVDHVTSEWRFTGGGANLSSRKAQAVPDAMRAWFAKHPTDRPMIIASRDETLRTVEGRPPGFQFQPSIQFPPGLPPF